MTKETYTKGLEGVTVAESHLCQIDGENGSLHYIGYSITDLVNYCTYEEVTYLLIYGKLPTTHQLNDFTKRVRAQRNIPEEVLEMVQKFPVDSHPMELLQAVIAYLSGYVKHKIHHDDVCNCRETLHQVIQLTTTVAALYRYRNNKEYVAPHTDLSHGANFLYMLRGEEPSALEGEIMDKCLILHAEHGFNASSFTARVVASTFSTCYCSISAAIGALYGRLHGGANEQVMVMIDKIKNPEDAPAWVKKTLENKQKIMGMGHRVYKKKDPRAIEAEKYLLQLSEAKQDYTYYNILKAIENTMQEIMEKKGKPIYPNVDFFSGAIYKMLGIPSNFFTPIFAMSRVSGWLAHILEQRVNNRIYRPRALYVGPQSRQFIPIEKRSLN